MKAVSPLSLEPRDLLWLFKVEEAKGNCAEQLCVCVCVCVQSGSSQAFWSLPLHRALSLSQPDSLPLNG